MKLNEQLFDAAEAGNSTRVKFLVENGANIHAKNCEALCMSALCGHLETVKFLVEKGADIHAYDDWALRWSAKNEHWDVHTYLKTVIKVRKFFGGVKKMVDIRYKICQDANTNLKKGTKLMITIEELYKIKNRIKLNTISSMIAEGNEDATEEIDYYGRVDCYMDASEIGLKNITDYIYQLNDSFTDNFDSHVAFFETIFELWPHMTKEQTKTVHEHLDVAGIVHLR